MVDEVAVSISRRGSVMGRNLGERPPVGCPVVFLVFVRSLALDEESDLVGGFVLGIIRRCHSVLLLCLLRPADLPE